MIYYTVVVPKLYLLEGRLNYLESIGLTVESITERSGDIVIIAYGSPIVPPIDDSFMLNEDGSYILQENGSKIII